MADNYLERQRDEYEVKKAAWLKSHKQVLKRSHTSESSHKINEEKTSENNQK